MAHILLLEDDATLAESLIDLLEDEGYRLTWAKSGDEALDATFEQRFDLLLLDVNVPGMDGFTLLRSLRDATITIPAIFITALADITSLAKGFEAGANDYLKKPFDFDELLIRIQALLRLQFERYENEIIFEGFRFLIDRSELYQGKNLVILTAYEQTLVTLFFKNLGRTIAKEEILYEVGHGAKASEGALRVKISKLRALGLSIKTLKSVGYRLG